MNHKYQNITGKMHVPAEWSERVLAVAGQEGSKKKMGWQRPILGTAACAAVLVLALLAAGVFLQTPPDTDASGPEDLEPALLAFSGVEPCANGAVFLTSLTAEETEQLDGTTQVLSLTFADGTEATGAYSLRKEEVAAFLNADGTPVLAPVLAGDPSQTVTGLYAVSETESHWLLWPVEGVNTVSLSNRYGFRAAPGGQGGNFHAGIDIPAEQGTPVVAAAAGTVKEAAFETDEGNYLVLDHGNGMETMYAHCLSLSVEAGDSVAAGQEIAAVGSTGMATGPHLHFEVRQDGEAQNPVAYFEAGIRDTLQMK